LTKEHPKQHRPWQDGGEQALDGTIAAAFAGPAGDAQHRDAASYHQQGKGYPTQSAVGRRCDMGAEALEKGYNGHHGLLRRLRVVVVVDNNSTIDLRQKPYQVANFGEGIAIDNSIIFYIWNISIASHDGCTSALPTIMSRQV